MSRIICRYAERARQTQRDTNSNSGTLADRRVVVSVDGGRIKVRKNKGGKRKKGRTLYETKWREAKMLIIYTVDFD